jgi:glutathione S-transferase
MLEGQLAKYAWVAGTHLSLADIALGPIVKRCINFPLGLAQLPKTAAWVAALQERPAFQQATAAG